MYTLATTPQSIGRTLDSGFKLFFAGFGKALLLTLVLYSLPQYVMTSWLGSSLGMAGQEPDREALIAMLVTLGVFGLVSMALGVLLSGIVIAHYGAIADGRAESFGTGAVRGLKAWPYLLIAAIAYTIAVALGIVLLVIPGIILMISLMLASYAIVLEGAGPLAALKRSHNLVWGNWWRTVTVMTIPAVIMMVLIFALQFGVVMVVTLVGFEPEVIEQVANAVTPLAMAPMMPMFYAIFVVLYHDLKLRKEGGDLVTRMEAATVGA